MKMEKKRLINKLTSLVLAVAMVFSIVVVMPDKVSAADKSFKNSGKSSVLITDEESTAATGEITWIKFKPKSNGYIKVSASNASAIYSHAEGSWQLCAGNKSKYLSTVTNYNTNYTEAYYYTDYFGVKKGTTYYLGVVAKCGVKINATFTKIKDAGGSKKGKAKSIAKKKAVEGYIQAGTSGSHWYKFNMPKPQKLHIEVTSWMTGGTTGGLYVTLSGPGVYTKTYTYPGHAWGKRDTIYTDAKIKAGTYYLQVRPISKTSTGAYKLKWK